jgi:hypothetical protein
VGAGVSSWIVMCGLIIIRDVTLPIPVLLAGLAGSEASARIRASDQLLNDLVAASLPPEGRVRSVHLHARADNAFDVRIVLRTIFAPPLTLTLAIARQPTLPDDPVVGFRLTGAGGLLALAGPFLGSLPPGLQLEGEMLSVNLATLLEKQGRSELLRYATSLRLSTEDSAAIVEVAGGVPR